MTTNEKDPKKPSDEAKRRNAGQDPKSEGQKPDDHTSQGHSTGAQGSATSSKEPTLRGATTDSSRVAKNPHDDMPTGGNIR